MNIEKHLIDLETKILFQEKKIEDLNDALYQQQQQIEKLEKKVDLLINRIQSDTDGSSDIRDNEKPPHY